MSTGAKDPGRTLTGALVARMHEALAAQRAGRFDDAVAAYDYVIAGAPGTYDAWHMRGVAHLQSHRFDEAEADIRQAMALRADLPLAESNLALVASGRESVLAEEEVSRAALPRFRPLVVDPDEDPLDGVRAGTRCLVIALGAAERVVARIAGEAAGRGAEVRRIALGEDGRPAEADRELLAGAGEHDVVVAVGCRHAPGDWTLACRARAVALVVDGSRLGDVECRLRDLSGEGRRRVRLAATHDAPVALAPLPHRRLAP